MFLLLNKTNYLNVEVSLTKPSHSLRVLCLSQLFYSRSRWKSDLTFICWYHPSNLTNSPTTILVMCCVVRNWLSYIDIFGPVAVKKVIIHWHSIKWQCFKWHWCVESLERYCQQQHCEFCQVKKRKFQCLKQLNYTWTFCKCNA